MSRAEGQTDKKVWQGEVGSYGSSSGPILARRDVAAGAAVFFHAVAKDTRTNINARTQEGCGQNEKNIICKGTVVLMTLDDHNILVNTIRLFNT